MWWSARSGRTAVPIAKNSVVCPPQRCAVRQQLHPDDALGVQRLGLGLHPAHRQLAGVVERLGELRQLDVLPDVAHRLPEPLVGDVVDAGAHHHAERRVAGLDQRPEVLAGQVGGERLVRGCCASVTPPSGARVVGLDRGADGDELGEVGAELLELDVQPDPDDAVGAELVGLGLHPGHRQLAGVVHGLREHVELLVLAPPADLEPDVVDARARAPARAAGTRPRGPAGTR